MIARTDASGSDTFTTATRCFASDGDRMPPTRLQLRTPIRATYARPGPFRISLLPRQFDRFRVQIYCLQFDSENGLLISSSQDKTVKLWNANASKPVVTGTFKGHTGPVGSVSFLPSANLAISGSDDKTIRVWISLSAGRGVMRDSSQTFPTMTIPNIRCGTREKETRRTAASG